MNFGSSISIHNFLNFILYMDTRKGQQHLSKILIKIYHYSNKNFSQLKSFSIKAEFKNFPFIKENTENN